MPLQKNQQGTLDRLQDPEQPGRRRRVTVSMPVTLELAPNCTIKAIIDDLSACGFRLRSRVILHVGQQVIMRMPRGKMPCRLRWVDGHRAGGEFIDEAREATW